MLANRIRYRNVKRFIRERELGRVALNKVDLRRGLFGETDEIAVAVNGGDFRVRIPTLERYGKRAWSATDFKYF